MKKIYISILLLLSLSVSSFAQVIIGTGTSVLRFPFAYWYGYTRDASIYTATEMNTTTVGGTITTISWYSSIASTTIGPTVIYLKQMGATTSVIAADWPTTIAGATTVYTGTPASWVVGWNSIDITDYAIPAGQNLAILVESNFGGSGDGTSTSTQFRYSTTTAAHGFAQQDGSPPTATLTVNANRPNVTLGGLVGPSCVPPITPVATAITTTTATVSWTAALPAPSVGYQWAVTTSATPPASGTATTLLTASSTGLSPNTQYYLHVRSACSGATFSTWVTSSFTTSCTFDNIPYIMPITAVTTPALPSCTSIQNIGNLPNTWISAGAASFGTTINAAYTMPVMVYVYNTTNPANDWLFTNALNLTAGTSYTLKFKYSNDLETVYPEAMEVAFGAANNAAAMTNPLANYPSISGNTVNNSSIVFTPATTGVYYVGFHAYSNADQDVLILDDVQVIVTPSCSDPSGLTTSPTSATAINFGWNTVVGATGYEWAVTTSATPPVSGTATAGTSVPVSGLVVGTQYYAYVRTVCAGPSFSTWSTLPFVWIPNDAPCGAINLTLGGPQDCGNTTSATSVSDPAFSCSTPNNTVWYKYTPAANGIVNVLMTQNGGPTGQLNAWVGFYTVTGSCPSLTLTQSGTVCTQADLTTSASVNLISPSLTAGVTYYIMIDGVSGASGAYCIQLQAPPPPPACVTNVTPINGATGVVLAGGASPITWNAAVGATSYDIYFGSVNPPTALIGNILAPAVTANITGLQYDSTYYWYIVPKNTGGPAVGCSGNTTSFTAQSAPANCVPLTGSGCTLGDRQDLFRIKGESSELNINTGTACVSGSYTDSTDHPVIIDMARGKTYWGQAKAGTTGDYLTIWIDANDNGFFETNERLLNNIPMASAAPGNINLFIPLTTAVGNHKLRARLAYYFPAPTSPTTPCGFYTYSDTRDYTVNIVAGGTPYTISTYASTGTCYTGAGSITIDPASNNNTNYVPLVDSSNALIAQLYPQNNDLGTVTTSYYKHNGPVRQTVDGRYYLDRNIQISVSKQPTTPYNLRFPYQNTELNPLIAQPGSGVTSQFNLIMTKNTNTCSNAITYNGTGAVFFPIGFGSISGGGFVDVTNITGGFSTFYLHGGSSVLPISIESFKGKKQGSANYLDWKVTCTNEPSLTLTLERSADGRNFKTINDQNATATRCLQGFDYTDLLPLGGANYYRLKVTSTTGKVYYSTIVVLLNKEKGFELISVAPNPTKNIAILTLTSVKAGNMSIVITDITGKVVAKQTVNVIAGNNPIDMNFATLGAGTYTIAATNAEGEVKTTRFVKY
jgi:hypothetical protein